MAVNKDVLSSQFLCQSQFLSIFFCLLDENTVWLKEKLLGHVAGFFVFPLDGADFLVPKLDILLI